jgi:hypothetical protein
LGTEIVFSNQAMRVPQRLRLVLWFLIAFRSRKLRRRTRMAPPECACSVHSFRTSSHPRYNPLFRCSPHRRTLRVLNRRAPVYRDLLCLLIGKQPAPLSIA